MNPPWRRSASCPICQAEVRLAALRQATRLSRFSARANIRAAVWDKPRSSLWRPEERRFMERSRRWGEGAFWALITYFYDIVKQIVNNF
jgi:hypothetical protein